MKTKPSKSCAERIYKIGNRFTSITLFLLSFLLLHNTAFSQGHALQTIHVKFKDEFAPADGRSFRSGRTGMSKLDRVSEKHGALNMERLFPEAGKYEAAHKAYGLHLWYKITFKKGKLLKQAIAEYRNLDYFGKVEECREYSIGLEETSSIHNVPPILSGTNDPEFSRQWHYRNTGQTGGTPGADIRLEHAWKTQSGSSNVIVAVIDGGINLKHPDLAGALWVNADEIPENQIDDDRNGYVDDVHGYNFGDGSPTIYPDNHGSHVAGTIGAVSNNGVGVSGIAGGSGASDGVRLMSCAGFGRFGIGGFEDAMVYAADNGAVISQNSWGGGSSAIEAAIEYFIARAGFDNRKDKFALNIQTGPMAGGIVIFAAGNSNTSDPFYGYPASFSKVLAVASTDHNDVKSYFSNYGEWVDIAAPGTSVLSTTANGYDHYSGTSMACPHVSGVAALVISQSQRQGLRPEEVSNRLKRSARDISIKNPEMNGLLGAGRLDALIALKEPDAIPPDAVTDLHATDVHYSSVMLQWTATGEQGNTEQSAEYEIGYSTTPLTNSNFRFAIFLSDVPNPRAPGETVSMEVGGLMAGTTYYFALKSRDVFDNISGISNIITITTPLPPAPQLVTTSLSETLYTGAIATRDILVKNIGHDDLRVRLSIPVLTPAPVGFPSGAKPKLFAINVQRNIIEQLDPKTGVVVHSVPMPQPSTITTEGLAFDGEDLFYARSAKIYKLSAQTGEVLRTFTVNTQVMSVFGLAWSGRYLYASVYDGGVGYKILEINTDTGSVLRTISTSATEITFGGNRGTLFVITGSQVEEIDITDGSFVRHVYDGNAKALGYSAVENLLFISDGSVVRAVNPDSGSVAFTISYPGTTSLTSDEYAPQWVNTTERVVTIASGATKAVPLTFNATGLATGQWTGSVEVIPVNLNIAPLKVPLQLNTTSGNDIDVVQELNFGIRFVGFDIDSVITVYNRGFSQLLVSDIRTDDSRVSVSHSSLSLAPGEQQPINVSVSTNGPGVVNAAIAFTTNDPDEGLLLLSLHADIKESPAITLNPASVSTTLFIGESTTLTFTATNTGKSELHWYANFAGSSSPGVAPTSVDEEVLSYDQSGLDEFSLKAHSPEPLTCLSYERISGYIYAKSWLGNNFYRYDPVANSWAALGLAPGDFSGQASSLNGKIYHGGSQLNIYDPKTTGWSSVPFPVTMQTGNITNDGQYVYILLGNEFHRYDPVARTWQALSAPTNSRFVNFGPHSALSYHNGVIYAHEDTADSFSGDGNTNFRKYFIETDSWGTYTGIPGKACSGSAIDPVGRRYFALGAPYFDRGNNIQMSILDLNAGEWSLIVSPFKASMSSGLVFVEKAGVSGIYFIQGYAGRGFARYETAPASEWINVTPSQGDLLPDETQNFTVKVNATGLDAGTYSGKLRVSSANPRMDGNVPLTVTVLGAPDITVSKTSVDFGQGILDQSTGVAIVIRNIGTARLNVSNITSDQPDFTVTSSSLIVQTGEIASVEAYFNPKTTGSKTGNLIFQTNDPDESSVVVPLVGYAVTPAVPVLTPEEIVVDIFSGTIAVHNITLSNNGGALMYYGCGFDTYIDWLNIPPGGPLAAGETTVIPITIDASNKGPGTHHKTLVFNWHIGTSGDVYVPVTINVKDAPGIRTSRESIRYGDRFVNNIYDSVLVVRNSGVLPLSINGIDCDNPVFTLLGDLPPILNPSESASLTVRFAPTGVGIQSGAITITSNDPDDGTRIIELYGKGVEPPVVVADAALTVSVFRNESTTRTLILDNDGGSVLHWRMEGETSQSSAGGFHSRAQSPEPIMALTIDHRTNFLYAQTPYNREILRYNPVSNNWSQIGRIDYVAAGNKKASAVILQSEMYCAYPNDNTNLHAYNFTLRTWRTIPHGLEANTQTITTDGVLLYVAGGGKFRSVHPTKKTITDLPLPTIALDGAGGLSYHEGEIYAHEGNGTGFARYNIATKMWETLVPLPGKAALGSAIDPVKKRYYAYGSTDISYLYEYDLASNLWNAVYIPYFAISDGGIVYVPQEGADGIYFAQGENRSGFAHYAAPESLSWMTLSPMTGEIEANDSQGVGVNFNAYNLEPGTYNGNITLLSNDPKQSVKQIDVTLNVLGTPQINVPDMITANVNLVQSSNQIELAIGNTGLGTLDWNFINTFPEFLKPDKTSGIVGGLSSDNVTMTFDPTGFSPGVVVEHLIEIKSNDLVHPIVSTLLKFTIVDNKPPIVLHPLMDQSLSFTPLEFLVASNFSDPENDPLVFTATTDDSRIVSVDIVQSKLRIIPVGTGTTAITVTATDVFNQSAFSSFHVNVDQTVGILDPEATGPELVALPNPFKHKLKLRYNAPAPGLVDIAVLDIQGKIVWQLNDLQTVEGVNEIEIETRTAFASGLYTCRLLRPGRISTVRIVKY